MIRFKHPLPAKVQKEFKTLNAQINKNPGICEQLILSSSSVFKSYPSSFFSRFIKISPSMISENKSTTILVARIEKL